MSNNQLPADVESRLDAAVKRRSLSHDYASGYKEGYIAGATAMHDRANVLVDALGICKHALELCYDVTEHPADSSTAQDSALIIIAKALEQWKSGKGKEVCTCSLQQLAAHGECHKCPGQHTRHEITNPTK